MNNTLKKSLVIISILLFLIPAISSTYAMSNNDNTKILGESQQKTITIYRVAPDESITPIEVEFGEATTDIGKYLESKCSELFEKDLEMQSLIQKLQSTENKEKNIRDNISLIRVKSHGRGFHIKTKINFCILSILKLNNQFILPRILLEILLPSLRKSIVVGFYNDKKANTTFYPIIQSKSTIDSVTYLEGNHTIIISSFYGYTTWTGRFSCLISEIFLKKELLPHAFSGVGLLVSYRS